MYSTKGTRKSQKGNLRAEQEAWKDNASDGLLMFHASTAHFLSATGRIHKLQASESEYEDPGELELPNEWCGECQVASKDKHACNDKSESKSMYRKSCLSTRTLEQEWGIKW